MSAPSFFVSPADLWSAIGTASAPQIVDVRRRAVFESSDGLLPGACWRDHGQVSGWVDVLDCSRAVVVACKAGHELSQAVAAALRARGVAAQALAGGYEAWAAAGLPLTRRLAVERFAPDEASLWVTRRRPKIDRIACPWLIRRFIDPRARILFVDPPDVLAVARETHATPFDIEGVELSHDGPHCSFDTMLAIFGLESEPALARLAVIVRGADTARPELAPEAAGLLAISLGLSARAADDDHALLGRAFIIYDALFDWARFAASERHNWPAKAA